MPNQIKEEVKKQRVHQVLELSKQMEINYMKQFINKKITFLPEVKKDNSYIGHTGNYLNISCMDTCTLNEEELIEIINIDYPYCIARKK